MLDLKLDAGRGIILLTSAGLLTVEEVQAYNDELLRIKAEARRRFGRVRVFVDSGAAQVQPGAIITELQKTSNVASEPGDKLAIFVASSLARLQMKRVVQHERERVFSSAEEAMRWLIED